MFGGQTGDIVDPANVSRETWSYDLAANNWTRMQTASELRKSVVQLAYDVESDRVILFGAMPYGDDWRTSNMSETWAYDYNTETWMKMTDGPVKHLGACIAYDTQSDRVILFGGYNVGGNYTYDDTWAYDFNSDTWTEMKPSTSPPGRNYQAMAYDDKADRVLVWGSSDVDGPPHLSLWAYDFNTNTWQERLASEPLPSGREYPVMVYDAESDRSIMFGGTSGGSETWAYDYNTNAWTNMKPSLDPGDRKVQGMAYNSVADRVIMFGGQVDKTSFKYTNETWTYDLNTNAWTNQTSQP
jgi:N-acetylneuraminic acid mutarotase